MTGRTHATGAWQAAGVFAGFALLTAVLFWSWLAHISTALIGPPEDNYQDFWNIWYAAVAADAHHFFHTTLVRFPEGADLHYHTFAYPQVLAIAALTRILGTDHATLVTLDNVMRLLSFPLAAAGAFLLVRRFTGNVWAALAGGFIFAFNPWHVEQAMHHAHVCDTGFIPLFAFAYLEALDKRSIAWLAAAVAAYLLAALSCWYYLVYLAFFVLFHLAYQWIAQRKAPQGWTLAAPLLCLAATGILLLPLLVPMLQLSGAQLYSPGWGEFDVDLSAFFVPPPTHLAGAWTAGYYRGLSGNPWEATAYLGLVNIGLLVWLCRRKGKDPVRGYALAGLAVFCILACGLVVHIMGHALPFALPAVVLWKLPLLGAMRTASRAMAIAYLFLAIAVGQALSLLWQGGAKARLAAVVAGGLLVLDFLPVHLFMTDATCPAALSVIRNDPDKEAAVLDMPRSYVNWNRAMFDATCHGHPITDGILARILSGALIDHLETRDLARQRDVLRQAHVKYIVLHGGHWPSGDAGPAAYRRTYTVVAHSAGTEVLRVY